MTTIALIGFPGVPEMMVILLIILVLFGGAKLPEMARNLGRGMRAFKDEANQLRREIEVADQPQKATTTPPSSSAATGESKAEDTTPEAKAEKA